MSEFSLLILSRKGQTGQKKQGACHQLRPPDPRPLPEVAWILRQAGFLEFCDLFNSATKWLFTQNYTSTVCFCLSNTISRRHWRSLASRGGNHPGALRGDRADSFRGRGQRQGAVPPGGTTLRACRHAALPLRHFCRPFRRNGRINFIQSFQVYIPTAQKWRQNWRHPFPATTPIPPSTGWNVRRNRLGHWLGTTWN